MASNDGRNQIVRIGLFQAIIVSMAFNVGTIFVTITREVGGRAGIESAVIVPMTYIGSLVFLIPILMFNRKFPHRRFAQISQEILGKIPGKVLSLSLAAVFGILSGLLLRNSAEFLSSNLMPETPVWFFMAMQVSLILYAVVSGFEVFARVAQILFFAVAGSLLFLFFGSLPNLDLENFLPLFAAGQPSRWLQGVLPIIGFGLQYALFSTILSGHLRKPSDSVRMGIWGWLGAAFFLSLVVWGVQGLFGSSQVAKFVNPPLELAKTIELGGLARGIEALIVASWMVAGFLQVGLYFYGTIITLSDTITRVPLKWWVPLVIVPVFTIGLFVQSQEQVSDLIRTFRFTIIIPFGLTAFLLLFTVAFFRGKLKKGSNAQRGDENE